MSRKQHFTCKRIFTVLLTCIFIVEGMFANSALVYAVGADEIEQVGMENDILATDPVDVTPPTVLAVSFGDSIEDDFIVQASDDISGPKNGTLYLRSVNTGEVVSAEFFDSYHDEDTNTDIKYEDGNLHGKLPGEKILNAGVFAIDKIEVWDKTGNKGEYYGKQDNRKHHDHGSDPDQSQRGRDPDGSRYALLGLRARARRDRRRSGRSSRRRSRKHIERTQ